MKLLGISSCRSFFRLLAGVALASAALSIGAPLTAHAQFTAIVRGRVTSTGAQKAVEVSNEGIYTENTEAITVLGAAARTATFNSPDISNYSYKGVRLYLSISAVSGTTPTLDVKLQEKDPASGNYFDIPGAAFAQKNSAVNDDLVLYPTVTVTANRSVSSSLPRTFRVVSTIGGTTPSFTYSIGATFVQ